MKKLIVTLLAVLMLSITAFAGPLLGLQLVPTETVSPVLVVGWTFAGDDITIEGTKTALDSWSGDWSLGCIWTPAGDGFDYRIGGKIEVAWASSGAITYNGLTFVIGVAKTLGIFQVYGELDVTPSGTFTLKPLLGINFLFEGLLPAVQSGSL